MCGMSASLNFTNIRPLCSWHCHWQLQYLHVFAECILAVGIIVIAIIVTFILSLLLLD